LDVDGLLQMALGVLLGVAGATLIVAAALFIPGRND